MLLPKNLREKSVYFFSMMITRIINGNKKIHEFSFQNILCIREDEIGDLCYSLHVFKSLKKQYPSAKITLLCKPFAIQLVKNDPDVDKATSDWKELTNDYDLIVDLRGSRKSNLYALKHRPRIRLDRGTVRYQNKLKGNHPHEVITNLQVIGPLLDDENKISTPRIYIDHAESGKAERYLSENNIHAFAVLHIGARRELRRWPLKNYATLAVYLKEQHQLDILFCGDKSDLTSITTVTNLIPFKTFSIAADFSLLEFSAVVSKADLFVGNESGPLHIASVSDTPSLGLFGPGEPNVFYPVGKKTAYLHHVLECNPCDQIHCVHPHNPCIHRITIEEVIEKVQLLLNR